MKRHDTGFGLQQDARLWALGFGHRIRGRFLETRRASAENSSAVRLAVPATDE